LANELGVVNYVHYMGCIEDKTELARMIAESDIGLIPYDDNPLWKNSVPAKFFEYCACGIPVIANAYTDSLLAHLIISNDIEQVVEPLDITGLVKAINWFWQNHEYMERAGYRARQLIESKYSRESISEKYLMLVNDMVSKF
jgi:glycosyltransferase involved in cell wall biosynthesis